MAVRWLVTGARGMLAQDLVELLVARGHDVVGNDRDGLDITDAQAIGAALDGIDVVANCAAYTAVDAAEEHEGDAFRANAVGAAVLAQACAASGARLVHISTDYVFDGHSSAPYQVDAPIDPQSAYGRTKAAGEWAVAAAGGDHLIVRTAWLYGARGPCFPKTIARVAVERGAVQVVNDQVGQPTWSMDLADLVLRLVETGAPSGIYHGTSSGSASWFDLAQAVVASAGLDPAIVTPTTSAQFVRPAPRPGYSVLGHDSLRAAGVAPIGDWRGRWDAAASDVLGNPA